MTIRDSIGCEFEAKPSNHPSGGVWLDTVIDGEIEQHQITPDDAEALALELIEAARRARSGGHAAVAHQSPAAALVRAFHVKYGLPLAAPGPVPAWITPEASDFRCRILAEEYREAQGVGDVAAMAHEAADLVTVLYGDAATIGYDLDAAIAEVMRANMTKGPEVGLSGKPVKGPDFRRADVAAAIGLDDDGERVPVHAHWPRHEAQRGACGAWVRKLGHRLDDSGGYAHTTCAACIQRLINDGVTLANPLGMADHLLRRMAADKPSLPE